jgi:hypothetical protein
VPRLVRLLESKGIVLAFLSFSDAGRVDAFSTAAGRRPTVVLTADKDNALCTRFTAGHELAHLLLHIDVLPGDLTHEREVNAFAAEFFMSAALAPELPTRVDLAALLSLQQRWGCRWWPCFTAAGSSRPSPRRPTSAPRCGHPGSAGALTSPGGPAGRAASPACAGVLAELFELPEGGGQ